MTTREEISKIKWIRRNCAHLGCACISLFNAALTKNPPNPWYCYMHE